MTKNKAKFYVVRKGKKTWIFNSRAECESSVKWFIWAQFKSFPTLFAAENALQSNYHDVINSKSPIASKDPTEIPFYQNSIAVDAACSGNPGVMEYQWIDLKTGKQIFYQKFETGTNNIWEFLALVHGLSYIAKINPKITCIYTDSKIAMSRVDQIKCKTSLTKNKQSKELFETITRAKSRLKSNKQNTTILKRDTKNRWEIPADFGRK